jgi:type II secretory pathway component GspD/PulD (secretin)
MSDRRMTTMKTPKAPPPVTARTLRRAVLTPAVVGFAMSLTACANSNNNSHDSHSAAAMAPTATEGSGNPPIIISGTPKRDVDAFNASENQLTAGTAQDIERKGPHGFFYPQVGGADTARAATQPSASGGVPIGRDKGFAGIHPMTPIDETVLPVKTIEMPDGKLKLIWQLRSYGGSNVTAPRDPANLTRRNVTVTAPDLTPLVTVITGLLNTAGTCVPIPASNTLVVTCDKGMKDSVLRVLNDLDVPARQVEITAKVFEVSRDFDYQQGANLILKHLGGTGTQSGTSSFNTQNFLNSSQSGAPFTGSVVDLMQASKDAGLSLEASFQLLAQNGLIKVVSAPRMTVAVGQTGCLQAGQELPIQNAVVANNAVTTSTTYKPVGVQLYITPQAAGADRLKLHTISVVSSVSGFTAIPSLSGSNAAAGFVNPIIDTREAETDVTVEDGSTLVISGLRQVRQTTREEKIPGLGDLPLLGNLFKNHREQQQMTDLYFFVTPRML